MATAFVESVIEALVDDAARSRGLHTIDASRDPVIALEAADVHAEESAA